MIEHSTDNRKTIGLIPTLATKIRSTNKMTSGYTAVMNGKAFENKIEDIIYNKTGYKSILNSKTKTLDNNLIRQYIFENIYGGSSRLDFRLNFKNITYYIECKFQRVNGSVDEKLPYTLLNINQHEGTKIIVIEGDGWRT